MAEVASAFVSLIPSARGFGSATERQVGPELAKSGKHIGAGLGKAMFGAAAAIGAGLGVTRLFSDSIGEAREAQKVGALTAQVIKTTGGVANVSAKQVSKLATAISNKVGVDDEAIQSGANLLLTFKNVRNEVGRGNKVFDRATKAAVDLSAAGFGDLSGTSKQLGKALNDPVKGITALSRSGVTFTDQQKQQIKTLVSTGKTLKAQKIILKEVESQVGGSAEAQVTAADKARVAWGNLKEQMGNALLPVIDKIGTVLTDTVIPAVSTFFTEMQNGTGAGGKVVSVLSAVGDVLGTVFGFLAKHKETVVTFVAVLGTMTAAFAILNAVMAVNPISLVIIAIAGLVTGLILAYKHSETFRKIVNTAFRAVAAAIDFAKEHWRLLLVLITGPFGLAIVGVIDHFNAVKNVCQTVFRFIVDAFLTVVGALINGAAKAFGWIPGLGGKLKGAAEQFNKFRDSVNRSLDGIHDKKIMITIGGTGIVKKIGGVPVFQQPEGAGATGAIIRRPTVALIGEAGPEALVPLNRTAGNSPLPSLGPQFVVENVYAQDVNDLLRQMQTRARHAAIGGVPQ